ncbi:MULTISPECIES: hypothetical protein [Micromonospora]|uniref:Uncharacterized protein n=1 Tax=Micromonospora sicca TaxID=2202420 RepID=A0A317DK22_9ACTN|nr:MULTISPECIES: hypothetical protein [unclassified Micromonospora]MBM0225184.1 hypothetical protein [Micromonospora sp. ATA51]PWR14520.1 hypothetical protein DKT69_15935 [Micromonospora sp. 4G51]
MMTTLVVLAVVAAVFAAGYGFVAWRDRARQASGEESAAARDARARQQRYEAERHGAQGEARHRDRGQSPF